MGAIRLRSGGRPPWGGTMVGIWDPAVPGLSNRYFNVVAKFFTPSTTTELGQAIAGAAEVDSHKADDTTNVVTSANATDQATANTLLNEIKADFNAHIASTTFHEAADGTNTVTSADATDLASSITLANELKADFNAHRLQSGVHTYDDCSRDVHVADATDLATVITLANEIKTRYSSGSGDDSHRLKEVHIFTIHGIMPGTYDVGVKADFSLNRKVANVVIAAGTTTVVPFGVLMAGDMNLNRSLTNGDSTFLLQQISDVIGDGNTSSDYALDDWRVPDGTAYGEWSAVPTARRRVY